MKKNLNTACVHAGARRDKASAGINTPVFMSTAHLFPNEAGEIIYPRWSNSFNHRAAAAKIAALEGAEAGLVTASGMAAEAAILFSLLKAGGHAVFQGGLYGGTQQLIAELPEYGVETTIVNSSRPQDFAAACKDNTRLIFLETPSNPLLRVTDLARLAELANEREIITIVDNTFATPVNQNPLSLGVDIVVHSGTKYLNGHSDITAGAIASTEDFIETFRQRVVTRGGSLNTFDCWLLERGLKTLCLRVAAQNANALALAEFLQAHPRIAQVHYPGLESHPDHRTAKGQMLGFGGMLSFEPDTGRKGANRFVSALKLITPAVSLGGVETILCFPAETSHIRIPREIRLQQGITDTLIRLSVGIEDKEDLIEDLERALAEM